MTNQPLIDALEARKPALRDRYEQIIRNRFARCIDRFGPSLRGLYNSEMSDFGATIQSVSTRQGNRLTDPVHLDEAKLAAHLDLITEQTVKAWFDKIDAKMGELEDATVTHLAGADFEIYGTREGRKVYIVQQMILNVSPRGRLFNQFPARIYLDGKFISAAKYAKAFS